MRIVIITGLSGSGKSTAVKALEDEGFFCLDNLPAALIPTFVDLVGKSGEVRDVALVMDIRGKDFFKGGETVFQRIGEAGHDVEIYFFEATDQVLIRRFSETRRRHPALESGSVPEGIRAEREQLAWLRRLATMVVDTSELNVHQLKEQVIASVKGEQGARQMIVHVQSFGYRFGLPLESDLVFDVRFLPNPYFIPELKEFSGLDPQVRSYVLGKAETAAFLQKLTDMLEFLFPYYIREGKSYLTISIGCTGGKHRSVVMAEELRDLFKHKKVNLEIVHRDIEKG